MWTGLESAVSGLGVPRLMMWLGCERSSPLGVPDPSKSLPQGTGVRREHRPVDSPEEQRSGCRTRKPSAPRNRAQYDLQCLGSSCLGCTTDACPQCGILFRRVYRRLRCRMCRLKYCSECLVQEVTFSDWGVLKVRMPCLVACQRPQGVCGHGWGCVLARCHLKPPAMKGMSWWRPDRFDGATIPPAVSGPCTKP